MWPVGYPRYAHRPLLEEILPCRFVIRRQLGGCKSRFCLPSDDDVLVIGIPRFIQPARVSLWVFMVVDGGRS